MKFRERITSVLLSLAKRSSPETPSTSFYEWLENLDGGPTATGITVNPESAMRVVAFYASIRILSESVASLPIMMYERRADGGRDRTLLHPVADLLKNEPNELMSSYIWKETVQAHVAARGNGYSYIEWVGGRVLAIHPLPPHTITPMLNSEGRLVYKSENEEYGRKTFLPREILHIPGLGYDGLVGYSPVHLAREAIGLSLASERAGGALFGHGGRPSGILSTDQTLTADQIKLLKTAWDASQGGIDNMGKTAVLSGGIKWQQITVDPRDMQFLETRKFQVQEIARMFRIPPHMLADLDRATFSNIEHQGIEFVQHTLRPWLVRWEGELNRKLLSPTERQRFFVEFLVDSMLRGDTASRHNAYASAIQQGWMSRNEVRQRENLNQVKGLDEFLEPQNMRPQGEDAEPIDDEPQPKPPPKESEEEAA